MTGKSTILSLYKSLLRESSKFSSYNFRSYAQRRVRDAFKENKMLHEKTEIEKQLKYGTDNLNIIKRQVIVGNLYSAEKLVIEKAS